MLVAWPASALIVAVVSLLILPLSLPFDGRLMRAAETAAHFPLFLILFWAWATLAGPGRTWPAFRRSLAGVALASVILELLQILTHRDPDLMDALFSILGGWSAVLLWYSLHTWHRLLAMGARALVLLLAVAACVPSLLILADRAYAHASFPLLASFEGRSEIGRWWENECRLSRVAMQNTHGKKALRVAVARPCRAYPGLFMTDVYRDWSAYRQLCFDLYLTGSSERALWVRADDRSDYPPYGDRAQTLITLVPGANSICLDLDSFLVTPGGRSMNRSRVMSWGMFFESAQGGETFFIDNIRLVR
jgi:hypothetical protein